MFPLIPAVRLTRSGLESSRLAFGLSRLHYLWSSRERQELLSHAAALGFRHFDVARNYGDGLAEAELGRFLRGQRDRFLVATKYGIPANPLIDAFRPIGQPLRVVQSVGRRMGLFRMAHPPLTAEGLRASVERSLRALGIDCIDLLLLHEPSLAQMPNPSALIAEVDCQKHRGAIRCVGLAGGYEAVCMIAQRHSALSEVVQVPEFEVPEFARSKELLRTRSHFLCFAAGSTIRVRCINKPKCSRRPS